MKRNVSMEALHKLAGRLAASCALAGGAMLMLIILVTCLSIVGRFFTFAGLGPIPGDVELVEMGMAFSVFSFFPWCQYRSGHARVDLLQRFFGRVGNRWLDVLANILMLVVAVLVAWRLYHGMMDKIAYNETTFIVRAPLAWGYAGSLVGACVSVLVAISCLLESLVPRPALAQESPSK